jgi:hypothetical protein
MYPNLEIYQWRISTSIFWKSILYPTIRLVAYDHIQKPQLHIFRRLRLSSCSKLFLKFSKNNNSNHYESFRTDWLCVMISSFSCMKWELRTKSSSANTFLGQSRKCRRLYYVIWYEKMINNCEWEYDAVKASHGKVRKTTKNVRYFRSSKTFRTTCLQNVSRKRNRSFRRLNVKMKETARQCTYSVKLWRFRLVIFPMENQQYVPFVLLLNWM